LYKQAGRRLQQLLDARGAEVFDGRRIGVEKESLRVSPEGRISALAHPRVLGSALTHPYITTDYSEAMLEFITPPLMHTDEVISFLRNTQAHVYQQLHDEILWATSMPCVLAGDNSIPLAQYGHSNAGTMKTVYRRGLGHRYGRVMQVISGVHFNYSFPDSFWSLYQQMEADTQPLQDFISQEYFGLIRNLQRFGWIVSYLFGASPAVCKSFLGDAPTNLKSFNENTYYHPYATSLRMGDIGYQNNKENEIGVKACYNSVDSYVETLRRAIETPCEKYQKIGINVDGVYQQLNANLLQIENEYYSTVRPKQILQGNEKPVDALSRRGVQYVELRSLDVNAFDPLGINETQLRFLEAFMIFCLLQPSDLISPDEQKNIDDNELKVAHYGRDPALTLRRDGSNISLQNWAQELCDEMQGICEMLDNRYNNAPYSESLARQCEKIRNPDATPSAIMLATMTENNEGFYHFAKRMSQQHNDYFCQVELDQKTQQFYQQAAVESLQKQQQIEEADHISFDEYLAAYFSSGL